MLITQRLGTMKIKLAIILFLTACLISTGCSGGGGGGGGGSGGGAAVTDPVSPGGSTVSNPIVCADADLDGFHDRDGCNTLVDCNDKNDLVFPGAPERCDGIDNQCPGEAGHQQMDEGCYAVSVAAGEAHSCVLLIDGMVKCWGLNTYGQLGGATALLSNLPVPVSEVDNVIAMVAGEAHTCALLGDKSIKCWGRNSKGQLGDGTTADFSKIPAPVFGITSAVAVAAGGWHTCAVLGGGSIECWGANYSGQLGDGTTANSAVPVSVPGITDAVYVSAGMDHTCAVLGGGSIKCWGHNNYGQLGDGSAQNSKEPVLVSGVSTAQAAAVGRYHTCALLQGGSVECWGYNAYGQLGDGSTANSKNPSVVFGINDAVAIASNEGHVCALLEDGTIKCWGYNEKGQLGDGSTAVFQKAPVTVAGTDNAVAIATGNKHTCAVVEGGLYDCWGDNGNGRLGGSTVGFYPLDCTDTDNDRYPIESICGPRTDCDDGSSAINPEKAEIECDNIDQNCNGMEDDAPDSDSDSHDRCDPLDPGDTDGSTADCDDTDIDNWISCGSCIDGDSDTFFIGCDAYTARAGPDCNDTDVDNWDSCAVCLDADNDAYYANCDAYTTRNGPDCNDASSAVNPGAAEIECDGIDQNCNGGADEAPDTDGDSFDVCDPLDPGDTDGSTADCNDADVDNQLSCAECIDGDSDNYFTGCDAYSTRAGPDCNDADADNWSSCAACLDGDSDTYYSGCDAYATRNGPDCNDGDSVVNPGSAEILCDGLDQNCNGAGDDAPDNDGDNYDVCDPVDLGDTDGRVGDCNDGDIDNWVTCAPVDLDGDGAFVGCDAYTIRSGPDCDDGNSTIYPGAPELCDGVDNQCPGESGYGTSDENCALAVAAGGYHTSALFADGSVMCWGRNDSGQLGNGSTASSLAPISVLLGGSTAVAIDSGVTHSCAVLQDGVVRCWGSNGKGQLGDGTTANSSIPVSASGIVSALFVSAGEDHTCSVLAGGSVMCWGSNLFGKLGDNLASGTESHVPVTVLLPGSTPAVSIAAGMNHSCAVLGDGSAMCWGFNGDGELGDNMASGFQSAVPVYVESLFGNTNVVDISAGENHSCALLAGGTAMCWGYNYQGQIGDGSSVDSPVPVNVTLSGATAGSDIHAGARHGCVVLADGSVRCWGWNQYGQLGDGNYGSSSSLPVPVPGVDYKSVSARRHHTCSLTNNGSILCWGLNDYGQLGDGSTTDSANPVPVTGIGP